MSFLTILLVTGLAFLPALPLWLVSRKTSFNVDAKRFCVYMVLGLVSLVAALVFRTLFPAPALSASNLPLLLLYAAASEEASRVLTLLPLILVMRGRNSFHKEAVFAGLVCGVSFAAFETLYFALTRYDAAILRAFTASPLHAACAARVAEGLYLLTRPRAEAADKTVGNSAVGNSVADGTAGSENRLPRVIRGLSLLAFAVLLHALYDFLLDSGSALFVILAAFIALTSFASALAPVVRRENG